MRIFFFFFQAEDGIRDHCVTGVQTCALPISRRRERPQGMVPGRERRRTGIERGAMRAIATGGIVAIGVVLGAVLVGQDVAGWIVGLAVSAVSIVLAALLWSSRQL